MILWTHKDTLCIYQTICRSKQYLMLKLCQIAWFKRINHVRECQFYSNGCVLLTFQVVVCVIIFTKKTKAPLIMKQMLKIAIFSQYVPRLSQLYLLYMEVTRTSGILTQTAWAGAAYNLFLYMLASHVSWFWIISNINFKILWWSQINVTN